MANALGDDLGLKFSAPGNVSRELGGKDGKCRPAVCCMYFGEFECKYCQYFVWESELLSMMNEDKTKE